MTVIPCQYLLFWGIDRISNIRLNETGKIIYCFPVLVQIVAWSALFGDWHIKCNFFC